MAQHVRCYQRGQLIVLPDHRLAALALGGGPELALEHAFDALGPEARQFHLHLRKQPVKTGVHLRRLLAWPGSTAQPRCWPPSPGRWSWRPTMPLMSSTCCWPNAADATAYADSAHAETPRTDRRHRTRSCRPALYDRFCKDSEEDDHGTT